MVIENTIQKEREGSGPVLAYNYSSEIKVRIKPNEKCGSCHTENNGGYVNSQSYHYSLDLAKGLQFEIYREDADEKYRFKYIIVDVDLD